MMRKQIKVWSRNWIVQANKYACNMLQLIRFTKVEEKAEDKHTTESVRDIYNL